MPVHPIPPVYNQDSEILILGSFPSVKSRESAFFYGHPQNRFWQVLAAVLEAPVPRTVEEKRSFLLEHHIALWDVLAYCELEGSADSTICSAVPTDLSAILQSSQIRRIFLNGKTAEKYFRKFQASQVRTEAICLPSTSPANASWSLEKLIEAWRIIRLR